VEDPKKVLLLYGNKTSQVVKDVLADIGKLKAVRLLMRGLSILKPSLQYGCMAVWR